MIPYREFDGEPGDYSVDTAGPEQLQDDLDKLFTMFNPEATHTDGTQGGIGEENLNFALNIQTYVDNWLNEHPEASTTIQDGAVTVTKLDSDLKNKITSNAKYIFPRNFGASVLDGDCNLIVVDDVSILIDAHRSTAYTQVKDFLEDNEVTHLDYFILSHYHADHYENIPSLISDGFIDENTVVYLPPTGEYFTRMTTDYTTTAETVIGWFTAIDITPIYPDEWDNFYPVPTMKISFYNCDATIFNDAAWDTDYNNCSMICLVEHGRNSVLYTGDAYAMAMERALNNGFIDRQIELYKINHHGINANDNIYPVITRLNPTYAVQPSSMGDDQRNNHDKNVEMQTLQLLGCKIFQCHANDQDIIFESDVDNLTVAQGLTTAYGGTHTQSQDIYVDISTTEDVQDGSQEYPFKELSQALSRCIPGSPVIYSIHLADGTYNNSHETASKNRFRASRSRIYLYGNSEDQSAVVIKNSFELNDCTFYAEYVTFDCSAYKCALSRSTGRFDHCTFTGNTGDGYQLELRFSSYGFISSSTRFEDFETAIFVSAGSDLKYSSLVFDTGTTGISVANHGMITEIYPSTTFTSVTTPIAFSDYAAANGTGRYIYETAATTQTFTGRANRSGLIFLTYGSTINVYFWNATSSTVYVKTIVEQIADTVTYTRDGFEITFSSASAITMFAKDLI